MPFVYMLRCADNTLYTGSAKDLSRRLSHHHAGKAAKYTKGRRPLLLIFQKYFPEYSLALKEEARIKKLTRRQKELLIKKTRSSV